MFARESLNFATRSLLLFTSVCLAQNNDSNSYKWDLPDADPRPKLNIKQVFPSSKYQKIYKKGWVDFNKNGKMDIYEDPSADIKNRVEDLLSQMNVNEKTGQCCTLYGFGSGVLSDALPQESWKESIWKDGIANIDEHLNKPRGNLWWPKAKHNNTMNLVQQWFVEETRLGIPVDFSDEGIAGVKYPKSTGFPYQISLGATFNRKLIRRIGEITGKEARALGYSNVYSPILEVNRDQRWGRYEEAYGESPFLCSELGLQQVLGIQQSRVVSSPKHYTLYSIPKGARGWTCQADPKIGPREAEMLLNWPFRTAFKEGKALGVMTSYNDYDGIPVSGSKLFLTKKLREDYNFRGYTVSDSSAVWKLWGQHHVAESHKDAVRMYIMAGGNVKTDFRPPQIFINYLRELVNEGTVPMDVLDERVRDVLKVKFWLGLFDNPYLNDVNAANEIVSNSEHNAVSIQAARECMVLLKNEGNLLPLDRSKVKSIALIGPNAASMEWGKFRYGSSNPKVITVQQGLKDLVGDKINIKYVKGCELIGKEFPYDELDPTPLDLKEKTDIASAVKIAKESEVIIAVVGGGKKTSGESRTRTSLDLPGRQRELLQALHKTGKPMIVVIISGRPLTINWTNENVPAILQAWFPGCHGGTAIAETLFGDYNPGGKLPGTFPKSVGQLRMNFPCKPDTQKKTGQVMARVDGVIYPFGYGLSYTEFKYSDLNIDKKRVPQEETFSVTCNITNTGKRDGDEVVQLYIRDTTSSITMYEKMLRGFERIHLKAGETKSVTFTVDPVKHLWLINEMMERVVEPGEFKIMVGSSSAKIHLSGVVRIISDDEIEEMKKAGVARNKLSGIVQAVSQQDENPVENMIDGNPATRWSTETIPAWLEIGLGKMLDLSELKIIWFKGSERKYKFEIQIVDQIGSWKTIYKGESSGSRDGFETYKFDKCASNSIRIIGYGSNKSRFTSIHEIKILGWEPLK